MSYMICEECGKQYELQEGKSSFNFEKCECGGKLKYSPSLKAGAPTKDSPKPSRAPGKINWKGVVAGFLFLFFSMIISVVAIYGTKIPTNPLNISPEILTILSILTIVLTVASGFISGYISGGRNYAEGAINGGMVGVILGFILGMAGGLMVFISGMIIFGSLTMFGGILGTIPRIRSQKGA